MRALALLLACALAAGCLADEAPEPTPREETQTDDAGTREVTQQFTGSATGTPAQPFSQDFAFEVPRGAVGVYGNLSWQKPPIDAPFGLADTFDFALLDPRGEVVAEGYPDVNGHLVVVTVEPPRPGTWTFRVSANVAANTPFVVDAGAILIVPDDNVIIKAIELGPRSFYEVNLILEEGASFSFSFNSSAPVRWDIHSHPPEGLKEWETGEGTTGSASFTAPARDVFSILWENTGALPVQLDFEVHGTFRVHSHSG
ncbi:MAG TPA: PPC domain-containing protein [Candidatus Thermoplasmatota archaeon]|nr:PPC domain-containing protein [Candidatus Thermoplasmatota archaeon]